MLLFLKVFWLIVIFPDHTHLLHFIHIIIVVLHSKFKVDIPKISFMAGNANPSYILTE